jgi:hypothetical protein
MPARIAAGRLGQVSIRFAKSGSVGAETLFLLWGVLWGAFLEGS